MSLNDYGSAYFYYFLTNLSDGNFINIADVVPDWIPFISKSFLTYFSSSPVYEIGLSWISTVFYFYFD